MHVMERDRTEERIDRLEIRVDAGFRSVDERFEQIDRRFEKIDDRFEKVNAEFVAVRKEIKEGFESQQRTMFQGALMLCGTMLAGFGGIAGLIAAAV
jgi:predicted transcriptional regulator